MDEKKRDAFSERIVSEVGVAMSVLTLYVGERLDLYQTISDMGSVTPATLANRTRCSERYIREWLECMVANGYLDYGPASGGFSLSPEHASVLLDRDSRAYAIPYVRYIPSFASVLPDLIQAFRGGGGVPYEKYGPDTLTAISAGNRAVLINDVLTRWIPAMPDIQTRLDAGGRVADVGCGTGWTSITLARGFRDIRIDAIDSDSASIDEARRNAIKAGVADCITFHVASFEDASLSGPFDLVTAVECVHDMPYPVRALRRMHEIVAPDGAVLIVDEAAGNNLEENSGFIGRLLYNFSVLHCLPQAMVVPDSAATGAVFTSSTLRSYARDAGFSNVEILPVENPLWHLYRLTP